MCSSRERSPKGQAGGRQRRARLLPLTPLLGVVAMEGHILAPHPPLEDAVLSPPVGAPLQLSDTARSGACHKCGAQVKDPTRVTVCQTCGCRYHLFDCGSRILTAGVTHASDTDCPRCAKLCVCGGGKIVCHTSAQRQKRKLLAASAAERRKRQCQEDGERAVERAHPSKVPRLEAPSLSDLGDDTVRGTSSAAAGTATGGGLHGQLTLRPTSKDSNSASTHLYMMQTEMFVMKARLAQLEAENAQLRRMLHDSGHDVPGAPVPGGNGAASTAGYYVINQGGMGSNACHPPQLIPTSATRTPSTQDSGDDRMSFMPPHLMPWLLSAFGHQRTSV